MIRHAGAGRHPRSGKYCTSTCARVVEVESIRGSCVLWHWETGLASAEGSNSSQFLFDYPRVPGHCRGAHYTRSIHSTVEGGWDHGKNDLQAARAAHGTPRHPPGVARYPLLWLWLRHGFSDLLRTWPVSLAFGVLFAALGYLLVNYAWTWPHLALALTSGFLLLAPFLAIVFYDLGRQMDAGERVSGMHPGGRTKTWWKRATEGRSCW